MYQFSIGMLYQITSGSDKLYRLAVEGIRRIRGLDEPDTNNGVKVSINISMDVPEQQQHYARRELIDITNGPECGDGDMATQLARRY